jgi:hypothetical protein
MAPQPSAALSTLSAAGSKRGDHTAAGHFADFDDFWATSLMSGDIDPIVATISAGDAERRRC